MGQAVSQPKRVSRDFSLVYRHGRAKPGDYQPCATCHRPIRKDTADKHGNCRACSTVKREPSFGAYRPAKMDAGARRKGSLL